MLGENRLNVGFRVPADAREDVVVEVVVDPAVAFALRERAGDVRRDGAVVARPGARRKLRDVLHLEVPAVHLVRIVPKRHLASELVVPRGDFALLPRADRRALRPRTAPRYKDVDILRDFVRRDSHVWNIRHLRDAGAREFRLEAIGKFGGAPPYEVGGKADVGF